MARESSSSCSPSRPGAPALEWCSEMPVIVPVGGVWILTWRPALVGGDRREPLERRPEQPGDLHLRAAEAGRDVALLELLVEAQLEHLALRRAEGRQGPLERAPVLHGAVGVVLLAEPIGERRGLLPVE